MSKTLGYLMVFVGIAILFMDLAVGYGLYKSINTEASSLYVPHSNYSTINSALGGLVNSIGSPIHYSTYTTMEIVVLFLFASIGYKFTALGISMLSAFKEKTGEEDNEDSDDQKQAKSQRKAKDSSESEE